MPPTRTQFRDVRVVGGPNDGLRMRVRYRPNGKVELEAGLLFFPGTSLEQYVYDEDAGTLTLREDSGTIDA